MRIARIVILGAAMAAVSAPASAAWKEYKYEDLAVAKEFPAEPKMTDGEYKTQLTGTNKAKVLSIEQDNAIFRMTVVDFHDKLDISAAIMGECTFLAEDAGTPIVNMTARIGRGVYGRIQTTDLKDKSRSMTECLFTNGRLYKIEAIVLPTNDDYPNSAQAVRFINSIDFNLKGEGPPAGAAPAPAVGGGGRGGGAARGQ